MDIKIWGFGYLVEPDYKTVVDWLSAVEMHGVSERIPTEVRAAKDLDHGSKRLGE